MNGWLGDFLRTYSAWWYWNTRKTLFVLRGRKGRCPCHNNSDYGAYGDVGFTRCDAVLFWKKPERFSRRVCPFLVKNAKDDWVCGVPAAQVKPFWGRVVKAHVVVLLGLVLLAGCGVWGTMRLSGFKVSPRQVFWPPAWRELNQVRGDFFREQARQAFSSGALAEAVSSLLVAREMNPRDFETAMMLAQLYHVVRPELVDGLYAQIQSQHPDKSAEIARVWCRSLLTRAQMAGVTHVALSELTRPAPEPAAWAHALIVAARFTKDWKAVATAAEDPKVPAGVRTVLALEAQLRRTDAAGARAMLRKAPPPADGYAAMHRVERLIEFGDTLEALELLRSSRRSLAARDVARLTLATHAAGRNAATLDRESALLLTAQGDNAGAAVAILAQHLICYPNEALLERCRDAFNRLPAGPGREEAAASLFCAAALAGRIEWLGDIRKAIALRSDVSLIALQRIEQTLKTRKWSPLLLLTVVHPVTTDLNYAVIERMIAMRALTK